MENLMNTTKLAAILGVGRWTIARWVREEKIPYIKLPSGRLRFTRAHLAEIVEGKKAVKS